jgi:hypothetical protein
MRWFKIAMKAVLAILLVFDTASAFQYHNHGLGIRFTSCVDGPASGEISCNVVKNTFTTADYWILAALVGVHLLLIYVLWHFRKHRTTNP